MHGRAWLVRLSPLKTLRSCLLLAVSGDMLGTAKDILGSDWSSSSDWSDSQNNKQDQHTLPLTARQQAQAVRSPSPNLASISEQTNVVMTSLSAVTGTSSSAPGTNLSRPSHESTCCSAVLADLPEGEALPMRAPSPNGAADMPIDDHDDAASEFSRSSSSNWGHNHQNGTNTEAPNRLQLSELIGRGAFGSVYKGIWKGRPAAIKVRVMFVDVLKP